MDSLRKAAQRSPFKRNDTSEVIDYGVSPEKTEIPKYDHGEVERRVSVASHNISGIRDETHRMLKPRHIQLIGIGGELSLQ
jgi:amino acid permease